MWKWEAEGQPKAVVAIVHSAYEHHSRYAWIIQKLRSSQFHVVMGDLPGHGAEVGARESVHDKKFDTYSKYVKKLLEVGIADGLPLFIIGHGLGATIVMRILQREKIECAGVILSSPWLQLDYQPPKYSNVLAKLTTSMKLNHEIEPELLTRNTDLHAELREDEHYNSMITAGWYKDLQSFMKIVAQSERRAPDIPILLHSGEADKITNIHEAKTWLLNQELSEFQYKKWRLLYHDIYQEPEREEVFLYTESFMHGVLRSLGYIV